MMFLLRLMRHEGYDFGIDVFDRDLVCTDPNDLWSANCAIPNLLFDNQHLFHKRIPYFKIIHHSYSEFFTFINSGGVIAKTLFIPLPYFCLKIIQVLDFCFTKCFPSFFALQRQIVLKTLTFFVLIGSWFFCSCFHWRESHRFFWQAVSHGAASL